LIDPGRGEQLPVGPEDKAREEIDRQLEATGWVLQDKDQLNLGAGVGVAVRNFSLPSGPCDYLLFIDRKVAGVIEAKPEGVTLTGVSEQSERYMRELPGHLGRWAADLLVFGYLLVGKDHVLRLDAPESPRPIELDDHRRAKEELPAMARSLVEGAGRGVERVFFADLADRYEPCAANTRAG
jgi:type I site-specific restriction endonuclease